MIMMIVRIFIIFSAGFWLGYAVNWFFSGLRKTREQVTQMQAGDHYHEITCSALRKYPMGLNGCSCSMYMRASRAEADLVALCADREKALQWLHCADKSHPTGVTESEVLYQIRQLLTAKKEQSK